MNNVMLVLESSLVVRIVKLNQVINVTQQITKPPTVLQYVEMELSHVKKNVTLVLFIIQVLTSFFVGAMKPNLVFFFLRLSWL